MSHDHRDHCDKNSLRKIRKLNPEIQYFTGLNMDKIMRKFLHKAAGQSAGWYQQFNTTGLGFNLYFLPTRHWSKRGFFDTNKRLWGSFILEIDGKTIYFGGDSGYGSHYKEIVSLFPNIDIAILGIGAYEPEWFMESNHSSPEKSYQAFLDLNAKQFIPMHYGTFDLSDEPIGYPAQVLEEIKKREGDSRIVIPSLGEDLSYKKALE
jgi:L-ascorbate metabolism protein UlaG (beta-lactamase superfamily)